MCLQKPACHKQLPAQHVSMQLRQAPTYMLSVLSHATCQPYNPYSVSLSNLPLISGQNTDLPIRNGGFTVHYSKNAWGTWLQIHASYGGTLQAIQVVDYENSKYAGFKT